MNKRVAYLDISKFIAIFSMVICHTLVPHLFDSIVHAFHMPIFFIVSGWCFNLKKHNRFSPFALSRIRTLIVPYFFWGIVLFFGWETFYYFVNSSQMFSLKVFVKSIFYNNALVSPFATVQWFLTCMFFAQIIGWCVLKICKEKFFPIVLSIILLFVIGWGYSFILPFRLPLSLDVALSSSGFFLVGWLIPNCIKSKLNKRLNKILLNPVTFLIEAGLGLLASYINGYVNMRIISFGNPLLFYFSAVMLSLAIIHFSYLMERWTTKGNIIYDNILFLGKNTLPILMLNQVFIQFAKLVVGRYGYYVNLSTDIKYILWFGFSAILMVIFIPVIKLINRYIPFSVGKKYNILSSQPK